MCLNQRTMLYVCTGKCAWIRELCCVCVCVCRGEYAWIRELNCMFAQVNVLESENDAVCAQVNTLASSTATLPQWGRGRGRRRKSPSKLWRSRCQVGMMHCSFVDPHCIKILCLFGALRLHIHCSFGCFPSRFFTCAEMYVSCNFMLRRLCSSKWDRCVV